MWLIKSEEETNPEYGINPIDRTLDVAIKNSVIIIDKHSGPTSHQISFWLKEIFSLKKVGHAGTLDPAVTGVLPAALENSVKAIPVFMGLDKEYVGVMHLHKEVDEKVLKETVSEFIGKIKQIPPLKSAVSRKMREREVYFFDILEIDGRDILFKVKTEAGTYIRKLLHDIGQRLEVGAHMSELRRIKAGNFTEDQSHSLLEVKDAYEFAKDGDEKKLREILIPIETAISHVKRIFVKDSAINNITNGSPVYNNGIVKIQEGIVRGETVGIFSLKEELIALGISKLTSEEILKAKKGLIIRTDRVFK